MYEGIDPKQPKAYRLRRDTENPTIWGLLPQTVAKGNKHLTHYQDAHTKRTSEAVAKKTTGADLVQFLDTVAWVENFNLMTDVGTELIEHTDDPEVIKQIFYQIDIASFNELMNASRDIFALTEDEKKESSSSSGQPSNAKNPGGSDTTAMPVPSISGGEDGAA